jgi:hypothetical protein
MQQQIGDGVEDGNPEAADAAGGGEAGAAGDAAVLSIFNKQEEQALKLKYEQILKSGVIRDHKKKQHLKDMIKKFDKNEEDDLDILKKAELQADLGFQYKNLK